MFTTFTPDLTKAWRWPLLPRILTGLLVCSTAWLAAEANALHDLPLGEFPTSYKVNLERVQYNGWTAFLMTNGIVTLIIAPDIGGRAIQLRLGDQDYFFVNKTLAGKVLSHSENDVNSGWANYGGDKVWPAPQGWMDDEHWPGPPYYELDGSKFQAEVLRDGGSEAAVRVTSPPDPGTGIQFVRTFHVFAGTTRVEIDQVMRNISHRRVRWGIWDNIQNDASDSANPTKPNPEIYMYVPINPKSRYPNGCYVLFGDVRHPSYQIVQGGQMLGIHYLYRVGKVAVDSSAGWYALVNGQKDLGLIETFRYSPTSDYPDGASVESWNNGPGVISLGPYDMTLPDDIRKTPYIMESEVLSPYATLDPGQEYSFPVYLLPTRISNPVQDVVQAGAVCQPLSAKVESRQVSLHGVYGVFQPGILEAVFYSASGEELTHVQLMLVDPRTVVKLDKSVVLPPQAFRVSLRVLDSNGENLGYLGNTVLK